jgi:glucosamine kinase
MKWLGVDGGGSTLRIALVDDDLRELATYQGATVNPNSIGHDEAEARIQAGIRAVIDDTLSSGDVGVGIGIAGASAEHSEAWLREVVAGVLHEAFVVPSSDKEIALVGGRGQLDGVVLLCGTGSVAYGRHQSQRLRAGGWGYLLGDEGSGYWIGLQAVKYITLEVDGRLPHTTKIPQAIIAELGILQHSDIIRWTYHEAQPSDIARLTQIVLAYAAEGDVGALAIVNEASSALVQLAGHVVSNLGLSVEDIVYAGGLLTADTLLQKHVTDGLGLANVPMPQYEPVIGGALLAKLTYRELQHAD